MWPASWVVAFAASLYLFDNRKDILRIVFQVLLIWVPLVVLIHLPVYLKKWKKLLLVLGSTALCLLMIHLTGPLILHKLIKPLYNLDIDHRPVDPPRFFDGAATQGRSEHFNILFLGDSFTMGYGVEPNQSFPFLIQENLRATFPEKNIKAVNFGWISSSPLLQLRQLRDIGRQYRPDLVVYALDMADFHQDDCYAQMLRDLKEPQDMSIFRVMELRLSVLLGVHDIRLWLKERLGISKPETIHPYLNDLMPLYQPRKKSQRLFENTWNNLAKLDQAADELGARFILFVIPRYLQYNPAECPRDPARGTYPDTDLYLQEPFVYLEEKAETAPFPVHSLLTDFRDSGQFPTVFERDMHWNETGHRIGARAMTRAIVEAGFLADRTAPPK